MEQEWGIYHNDLHPGNIMARVPSKDGVRDYASVEWCIIDWGRATLQREGCFTTNACFHRTGPAYGHLKLHPSMPMKPNSMYSLFQSKSGGDMIGFIAMLDREPYLRKVLRSMEWLTPYRCDVKGDGLHVFRESNKFAEKHSFNLTHLNEVF